MKKLLILALFSLIVVPAMAATIYISEDGNNKVDLYGNLRANIGYGFGSATTTDFFDSRKNTASIVSGSSNHMFNYGLQGNSRLGVTVKLGAFTGQVEFGANEKTLVSGAAGTIGLRQAWAMFSSKKCGWLAFGKMDTPTSMGGYISTGWDNDNSLLGYGGSITSMRRFQIQYAWNGLQISLIEKENGMRDVSVRPAVAYNFTGKGLKGKVGITGALATQAGDKTVGVATFGVTFGIKKQFNDFFGLAFIARIGLNENRYGEAGDRFDRGYFASNADNQQDPGVDGLRAGFAFEFSISPVKLLDINIGLGYQATVGLGSVTPNTILERNRVEDGTIITDLYNALALYVRLPIKLDAHWHLIPELGTHINLRTSALSNKSYSVVAIDSAWSFYAMLQLVSIF